MKEYEVLIERSQPPCGGKPSKIQTFVEIETDDPLGYVLSQEKDREFEQSYDRNGDLVFTSGEGVRQIKFTFTEI